MRIFYVILVVYNGMERLIRVLVVREIVMSLLDVKSFVWGDDLALEYAAYDRPEHGTVWVT